jgi:PAS domain S-box-containing protein
VRLPLGLSSRLPGERGLAPRLLAHRWILIAATGLPIAIMVAIGIVSWRSNWREAERELSRSADAVAEYVLRVLDGHRVAADRANDILEPYSNEQIQQREAELHERLAQLLPDFPLVQTIAVSRPDGLMLVTANVYPVPPNTVIADREWIRDLGKADAPRTHISKISVGRLDRNLFFGVSRRRVMAANRRKTNAHDGVINVSIEPNRMATGFADLISEPTDIVAVLRTDGEILARRPGFPAPLPPLDGDAHRQLMEHVAKGAGHGGIAADFSGEHHLAVGRPIAKFPVVVTVARSDKTIRARWWSNFSQHLSLGIPAIILVAAMAIFTLRRGEELERSQAAARFHAVFGASPIAMAVVNAQTGSVIAINEMLSRLVGIPADQFEIAGLELRNLVPPDCLAQFDQAITAAGRDGTKVPIDIELQGDGRRIPVRMSLSLLPGDPRRIVLAIQDMTEVRETEARRDLMMREVEHRSKNTLAVVQAALRLGAAGATDAQALARAVEARVAALARSQSMLTRAGDQGASLRDLVEQEVAPFAPTGSELGRLVVDGEPVRVTPKAAQALTMVLHELATNAAKYGAFSSASGSLRVAWHIDLERNVLSIAWLETGGHYRGQPRTTGFGTRLIDINIEHELGGSIERTWKKTGLAIETRIPLEHVVAGQVGR